MRGRALLATAAAGLLLALAARPALGHATFPATVNPQGSAANPLPGDSAQYLVARVPEERPGPPKQDNVDVRMEVPAGWTDPACQDALTAAGAVPGQAAPGWACTVEPGSPTVIHWTRAAGATSVAVWFPFVAVTGGAGTFPVVIHQTYGNGEVVSWKDVPVPPGCTTGTNAAGTACTWPAPRLVVGAPAPPGYWLAASDGGVFTFGDAAFHGSTGDLVLNKPVVGLAPTPSGKGYWLVASDGGVFTFGDAAFHGSTGDLVLNKPVVGLAPTPSGKGYWLVASDGGVFSYGDASFYGSTGDLRLNQPITAIAATPSGRGYWLVASDGGLFTFGDAGFFGSAGDIRLARPIAAVVPTPSGGGYSLVGTDGGLFSFGNAGFLGAGTGSSAFVGGALTPSGGGYWLATGSGQVQSFGNAPVLGSTGALNLPVVAIAAM